MKTVPVRCLLVPPPCRWILGLSLVCAASSVRGAEAASPESLAFFETKIRPVLAENCYGCHSAEAQAKGKLKAGLYADSREGLQTGGETGPALVAGKPAESLLLKVLNHEIKGAEMPPKGKLPAAVIADLARWIEMGAPDPR
ncbi:MAG: hypothetical protein KGR69_05555, partial [Verrucomicrobia bacterium]|nr:hypothetical protein [Verrucomicrobiota bacterium]